MKAELKQKWVDALRSGKYKQCESNLHSRELGFCCLGVLAETFGPEWVGGETFGARMVPVLNGRVLSAGGIERAARSGELSAAFLNEVGVSCAKTLMNMNDTGKSFAEIADYIEANIPADDNSVAEV